MKKSKTMIAGAMVAGAMALQSTLSAQPASGTSGSAEIRPFHVQIPAAQIADLRKRVLATNWPERETVADESQGVTLGTMQKLAQYWATSYDWKKCEAKLNAVPMFITNIDGVDIHFIHVKSKHKNALPIIITHGWPGSFIEQMKVIGPLTDPTAYGGKEEDAFDVVIPSLPGYGFSGKPTTTGWDGDRIAKAWIVLMERLGYKRYVAAGGDWGDNVTENMAVMAPPGLIAIHTNMPATLSPEISTPLNIGGPTPAGLGPEEQHAWDQLTYFWKHRLGYAIEMANRPQTLYGIMDSPVGLAAWMIDHDTKSEELIERVFNGATEGLSKDDILDNITMYWFSKTAISSARLYYEDKRAFFDIRGIKIPVAVSAFPDEIYQAPRSWSEKAFPKLIHYNRLEKGGHFAAWEQPKLYSEELRASFRSLRS